MMVFQAREHSPDTVCQAIWWCLDGFSEHHGVTELDNPAGFLTTCLPGIVYDYVRARDRQASEEGVEDRAGFDLYGWCREQQELAHQEQQARAALEAQAEQERQERAAEKERQRQEAQERAEREAEERRQRKAHRNDHPDHYEDCGRCRSCMRGDPCSGAPHRADDSPQCKEFSDADAEIRASLEAAREYEREREEREDEEARQYAERMAQMAAEQRKREDEHGVWAIDVVQVGPDMGKPCAYNSALTGWGNETFRGTEEELLAKYPELRGQRI